MASKFTYDTANKLFVLNAGVITLDLRSEFYAWVKNDWKDDPSLTKFKFPILAIGGQDIGGSQSIAPYYQLRFGWKIRPQEADHILTVAGNLITDDGSDPFVSTIGDFNVRVKFVVSANAVSLSTGGGGGASAVEIRQEIDANSTIMANIQSRLPNALVNGRLVALAEVVTDKSGYALQGGQVTSIANESATAVLTQPNDGALSVIQTLRLLAAVLFGKVSGGGTSEVRIRDVADTKDRVIATVDSNGNRSSVILDGN
jgi:hypothetical protein